MEENLNEEVGITSELEEAKKQVDVAKKEVEEINNKYLRLYAEFDNYRKRTVKEKSDILSSAGENVIKSILPTLDNFERAIANTNDNGIELIYNGLLKNLETKGLKAMESIGSNFTPELHEAITQIPSEDMKGKVVDVLEKGYLINGKVIRFAKVVVGF